MIDIRDERRPWWWMPEPAHRRKARVRVGDVRDFLRWREMEFLERRNLLGMSRWRRSAGTFTMEIDAKRPSPSYGRKSRQCGSRKRSRACEESAGRTDSSISAPSRRLEKFSPLAVHTDTGRRALDEQQVTAAAIDQAGQPASRRVVR